MIGLPRDAEGREIPLDTKAPYGKDGSSADVDEFDFGTGYPDPERKWTVELANRDIFFTAKMSLNPPEPPDSRERPEEDSRRASERNVVVSCCRYLTAGKCADCPIHGNVGGRSHKEGFASGDILDRVRKLKEDE